VAPKKRAHILPKLHESTIRKTLKSPDDLRLLSPRNSVVFISPPPPRAHAPAQTAPCPMGPKLSLVCLLVLLVKKW
jgi:hypothetical protein